MRKTIRPAATRRILSMAILTIACGATARAQTIPSVRQSPPRLADLVREARARNPGVIAARLRWEALERAPIQARTLPDPEAQYQQFSVGSPNPAAGYETSNFYYSGFGFAQEIPGPGKLRLRGEIAQRDADLARHQYEAAQRAAAEQVREDYFELYYLTKTVGLLERERDDLAAIAQIAQARYRVGEGQAQDVLKAQLEATRMLDEIVHHHREMDQRQAEIKAALGRDPDSVAIAIGDVAPTRVELTEAGAARTAADRSTDVMMDRAAEEGGEKAVSLARQNYIPDFTIGYSWEKTGPGFRDYYMLSIGAKIPLYFWRRQTPALEQAELELAAARSRMRAHQLDAGASAASQLVAIRASDRVLSIYRDGLIPQADNSLRAAMAEYRASKADFQTLISAFVELLNLNQEYYRELADREIAVARLEQVIGDLK